MNSLSEAAIALMYGAIGPIGDLPWRSQMVIFVLAVVTWPLLLLVWSLLRWLSDLFLSDSLARELTLRASDDGFIMLGQWDAKWIGGAKEGTALESKQTTLLIKVGRKTARGTVRYSQAKDMGPDVLGIPEDVADKLGLHLEAGPTKATASVRVGRRFALEKLWNNPDQSIKVSFRTAVWLSAITTALPIIGTLAQNLWDKL